MRNSPGRGRIFPAAVFVSRSGGYQILATRIQPLRRVDSSLRCDASNGLGNANQPDFFSHRDFRCSLHSASPAAPARSPTYRPRYQMAIRDPTAVKHARRQHPRREQSRCSARAPRTKPGDNAPGGGRVAPSGQRSTRRGALDTLKLHASSAGRSVRRRDHHRLDAARLRMANASRPPPISSGRELRSDGVRVSIFRQALQNGQWVDSPVSPVTVGEIENKVLSRARELREQSRPTVRQRARREASGRSPCGGRPVDPPSTPPPPSPPPPVTVAPALRTLEAASR